MELELATLQDIHEEIERRLVGSGNEGTSFIYSGEYAIAGPNVTPFLMYHFAIWYEEVIQQGELKHRRWL